MHYMYTICMQLSADKSISQAVLTQSIK